jgi:hypothetical protein
VGEFIMPNFSTDNLQLDDDKSYYLYAKLEEVTDKTQDYQYLWELTDVRKSDEINTDTEYVLFGILSSVFEGLRTFNQVSGYTSIIGGKITTEVLKDKDNNLVVDFANKRIIAKDGATISGNIVFEKKDDSTYLEDEVEEQSKDISVTWNAEETPKFVEICECVKGATYRLSFSSFIADYYNYIPQEYRTNSLLVGNVDISQNISPEDEKKIIPLPIKGYIQYKEPYNLEFTALENGTIKVIFSGLRNNAYNTYYYFENYLKNGYAELKGLTIQRKLPNSDVFESVKISDYLSKVIDTTNIDGGMVITEDIIAKKSLSVKGNTQLEGDNIFEGKNTLLGDTQVKGYFARINNAKRYATYPSGTGTTSFYYDVKNSVSDKYFFNSASTTATYCRLPATIDALVGTSRGCMILDLYTCNFGSGKVYITISTSTYNTFHYNNSKTGGSSAMQDGTYKYLVLGIDAHVQLFCWQTTSTSVWYFVTEMNEGVTLTNTL